MADEFNTSGNWWDSSRSRFESGTSSSSLGLNNFEWPTDMADIKARTTMDSLSVSVSSVVLQDTQKLQGHDQSAGAADSGLHMMGLGLSTQAMDWNQALLRGEKGDGGFRSMLQENLNSAGTNFQQEAGIGSSQVQWREKLFSGGMSGGESAANEFKQLNRGFSLDQPPFSPQYSSGDSTVTCQGMSSSFPMDSALYGSPSTILQGLLGPDSQPHQQAMNFPYPASYGVNSSELLPSWSKVPQFLRTSPPKQQPQSHLHFSNNALFWNASEAAAMKDVRSTFFPSHQPQFTTPSFDEKPKNISEVRDSATAVKKSGSEATSKRPRSTETPSPLPAFKVRKEKMGDRITALQQLVSPFGKTDTASVLSEAIEYIKFLHEQLSVLSTPYMKSSTGAPIQHQQEKILLFS
ncbi:transcription factor bHLH123 isoform X2 [Corylus avellana]|uniref:transcription factor bHLH123 isoform X2 n=1 Tax=Corylus avellana TaxID=13451 RepID=UPI00286BBCCE|nr:transcription factor bHLH123 isoform X2 [Corylus avellana]